MNRKRVVTSAKIGPSAGIEVESLAGGAGGCAARAGHPGPNTAASPSPSRAAIGTRAETTGRLCLMRRPSAADPRHDRLDPASGAGGLGPRPGPPATRGPNPALQNSSDYEM